MRQDGKIDYVEMCGGAELAPQKAFYASAFGWRFTDYGPSYADCDEGLNAGFYDASIAPAAPPLVVLYASDLEAMRERIRAAGGQITRDIFPFPGGRRFHFRDPAGNELGVWTEAAEN